MEPTTDHAAIIVDHIRRIMASSDWNFHGPNVERIVCKAISDAQTQAVMAERQSILDVADQTEK